MRRYWGRVRWRGKTPELKPLTPKGAKLSDANDLVENLRQKESFVSCNAQNPAQSITKFICICLKENTYLYYYKDAL